MNNKNTSFKQYTWLIILYKHKLMNIQLNINTQKDRKQLTFFSPKYNASTKMLTMCSLELNSQ